MSRLLFKDGISLIGIQPETVLGILASFASWSVELPQVDMVLTAVTDGKHSESSLHYVGYAFDVRTRHLDVNQVSKAAQVLKKALGGEFDVVKEKTHIHVEYQPKKNR